MINGPLRIRFPSHRSDQVPDFQLAFGERRSAAELTRIRFQVSTREKVIENLLALSLARAAEEAKQARSKEREKATREKRADEMI